MQSRLPSNKVVIDAISGATCVLIGYNRENPNLYKGRPKFSVMIMYLGGVSCPVSGTLHFQYDSLLSCALSILSQPDLEKQTPSWHYWKKLLEATLTHFSMISLTRTVNDHLRCISNLITYEPPHDKTNKIACAASEHSDQPGHPPNWSEFALSSLTLRSLWQFDSNALALTSW